LASQRGVLPKAGPGRRKNETRREEIVRVMGRFKADGFENLKKKSIVGGTGERRGASLFQGSKEKRETKGHGLGEKGRKKNEKKD